MLAHTFGCGQAGLLLRGGEPVGGEARERFIELVLRRAEREPLQYILGRWPFLEHDLTVDSRALIPRPETEDLALIARRLLPHKTRLRVADVGTGSGCLAIALAYTHRSIDVTAIDVCPNALALARHNAAEAGLDSRIAFRQGHLLEPLDEPVFMIVANLPYVAEDDWSELQPEVRDHEPRSALVAADAGLQLVRELCETARDHLDPQGWLVMEMDPSQVADVTQWLSVAGWSQVRTQFDRFDRERFVLAQPS